MDIIGLLLCMGFVNIICYFAYFVVPRLYGFGTTLTSASIVKLQNYLRLMGIIFKQKILIGLVTLI